MNSQQKEALERLIAIAKRNTGQCRRVADFLLSWWNSDSCGGWSVRDVWSLDNAIAVDIFTVLELIWMETSTYPDTLGYAEDFLEIIRVWRPHLLDEAA